MEDKVEYRGAKLFKMGGPRAPHFARHALGIPPFIPNALQFKLPYQTNVFFPTIQSDCFLIHHFAVTGFFSFIIRRY